MIFALTLLGTYLSIGFVMSSFHKMINDPVNHYSALTYALVIVLWLPFLLWILYKER